jgi:hypothetical protein
MEHGVTTASKAYYLQMGYVPEYDCESKQTVQE